MRVFTDVGFLVVVELVEGASRVGDVPLGDRVMTSIGTIALLECKPSIPVVSNRRSIPKAPK